MELKAPKDVSATGVVVEAQLSKGLGPIATVIVKRGVLKPGDPLVIGTEHGRVRALRNSNGKTLAEAGPGQAVVVSGLRGLPAAGDELLVVQDDARAARMASARSARAEDFRLNQLARMQAEAQRYQQALREQEYERWVYQISALFCKGTGGDIIFKHLCGCKAAHCCRTVRYMPFACLFVLPASNLTKIPLPCVLSVSQHHHHAPC